MTDEIMMELHAIKDEIGAKYGNNLDAQYKEIQLGEACLKAAGAQVLPPQLILQACLTLHCSGRASLTAESQMGSGTIRHDICFERQIELADHHSIVWQGSSASLDADHGNWQRYLGV